MGVWLHCSWSSIASFPVLSFTCILDFLDTYKKSGLEARQGLVAKATKIHVAYLLWNFHNCIESFSREL